MALDYTGTNTGLFTHLGKIVKYVNAMGTDALNEDTYSSAIQANWSAGSQQSVIDLLGDTESATASAKSSLESARASLATVATSLLTDHATVVTQLGIASDSINDVLAALITQMIADSQTVKASSVSIGAATAVGSPVGNNTILTTTVLDGVQQPGSGMAAQLAYRGVSTQLAIAETEYLTCTSDSYSGGTNEGAEQWQWSGGIATPSTWSTDAEGSGSGVTITTMNASTLIANGNFENFATANVPDSWTIDSGTAGTNIKQDNSVHYRGSSSVEFLGDGATATIQISQPLSTSSATPGKAYCLSLRYMANATDLNGVHFTCKFTGTGYSAAGSEQFTVTGDVWSLSWQEKHFFIVLPLNMPSDFKLVIQITGTMANGKMLWVDSLAFGAVNYFNGVGMVVVAGSTPPVQQDKYSLAVTNTEGVFSRFMRRQFSVQLPASGSPTISDTLAT